jgi:hypothetical protein
MRTKQYLAVFAIAVIAGVGGAVMVMQYPLWEKSAFAQGQFEHVEVVQTKRLELVDEEGMRRAVLGLGTEGEPALELYDDNGELRVGLSLMAEGGPNLLLWDGKITPPRAGLALLPNGSPSLELADQEGKLRLVFGVGTSGEPVLGFFDREGNLYAALESGTCEERSL